MNKKKNKCDITEIDDYCLGKDYRKVYGWVRVRVRVTVRVSVVTTVLFFVCMLHCSFPECHVCSFSLCHIGSLCVCHICSFFFSPNSVTQYFYIIKVKLTHKWNRSVWSFFRKPMSGSVMNHVSIHQMSLFFKNNIVTKYNLSLIVISYSFFHIFLFLLWHVYFQKIIKNTFHLSPNLGKSFCEWRRSKFIQELPIFARHCRKF